MADESLDVQLRVLTQQASRDAKKFLADMQRELNKGMRPQGGKKSEDPFTAGMRAGTQKMKDEQRERDGILQKAAADREKAAQTEISNWKRRLRQQRTERQQAEKEAQRELENSLNRKSAALEKQQADAQKQHAQEKRSREKAAEAARTAAEKQAVADQKAADKKVEADRKARNQMWAAMQKGMARRRKLRDAEVAAEQKAAQAVAAAWAKEAAERRGIMARADGRPASQDPRATVRNAVSGAKTRLIDMASDRSVPIEKVREQERRLTAIVVGAGRERLAHIRRAEEQAVQVRKITSDRTIDITRIRDAKLRAAAANVQAEMLAAAKSGDARQIARAERLGASLVQIKKRNSQQIINTVIQQEMAAGKISKRQAAEMMAMQGAIGKNASRSALQLFQLQQAAEDASAALSTGQGLPGVIRATSNNLALMANLMGGTGGTIALYGLLGVSVLSVTASLFKLFTTTKKQNEEAERQNELLSEELRLRLALAGENAKAAEAASRGMMPNVRGEQIDQVRQAVQDIIRGGGGAGLVGDVSAAIAKDAAAALGNFDKPFNDLLKAADGTGRLKTIQEEIRLRKEAVSDEQQRISVIQAHMKDLASLRDRMMIVSQSRNQSIIDQEMAKIEELQNRIKSNKDWFEKNDKVVFDGMFPGGGKFSESGAKKQIDELRKGIASARTDTEKMKMDARELLLDLQENADLKARALIAEAESNDVAANALALILEQNDAVQKQLAFRKRLADMGTAEEAANRRMMDDAERRKADAEAELATANRIFEKEKDRIAAIQDEAKKAAELLKAQEDHNEAVDKHKAVLEEINILEEERKRIQQEQLSNQRDMLRDKERELEQGRRQIEQAIELQKRLMEARQSSRDSFEGSAFDIVRGRTQEMTGRQAEVAKSNLSPFLPQQVRDFYGQIIDQQFSQLAKLRDDALLEIRGKFLSDQAGQAGASGDVERQRKLLEELQGLQLGVAANDPDMARGRAAFEAAKETQKLIEETYKNQFDAEQARIERLEQSNAKLVNALDRLRETIERMEREARGLPPKPEHPSDLPPREPVDAPRPPKPEPPPKPPVPEPPPKPPVEAPKPPMGQPGGGMPKPPVEAPRPPFDPMNPDGRAFAGLPLSRQMAINDAATRDQGWEPWARELGRTLPEDQWFKMDQYRKSLTEASVADQLGTASADQKKMLEEYERELARADADPAIQHGVKNARDRAEADKREADRQKMRDELEDGKRKAEEQRRARQSEMDDRKARQADQERRSEFFRNKKEEKTPKEIADAGDDFRKSMDDVIAKLKGEDPLLTRKGADDPDAERDTSMPSIEKNTKQTEREVAQHSSKTDTTNAILRELVAVQRQIASTPPTVIVAGGGGGGGGFPGFPMPTFPGFPGGGGGPIREEPAGSFGGFGGAFAAASTTNNNTFGQVMINVANMNQAQDLFRGMSLASRANSLRAGR